MKFVLLLQWWIVRNPYKLQQSSCGSDNFVFSMQLIFISLINKKWTHQRFRFKQHSCITFFFSKRVLFARLLQQKLDSVNLAVLSSVTAFFRHRILAFIFLLISCDISGKYCDNSRPHSKTRYFFLLCKNQQAQVQATHLFPSLLLGSCRLKGGLAFYV